MFTQLIEIFIFIWAGMILGISFLASWVKFSTPSLTKPIGLDVGRTVFRSFHKVQCILFVAIIFFGIFAEFKLTNWTIMLVLAGISSLQFIWLFPKLSKDVDIILSGNLISDSYTHAVYGVCEIGKFLILILLGVSLMV